MFRTHQVYFHGLNADFLYQPTSQVYPFDQRVALENTYFYQGLCIGFTASLMRHLLMGNDQYTQLYSNPLPPIIFKDAVLIEREIIQAMADGIDQDSIIFCGRPTQKVRVSPLKINEVLSQAQGATLIYKTKSGIPHCLLFFHKSNNKCIIQDSMRFTVDNVDFDRGSEALKQIVMRSEPQSVTISFNRRFLNKL